MFSGLIEGVWLPVKSRRLQLEACKMFGYRCAKVADRQVHVCDYKDLGGSTVAQHIRYADDKYFTWSGEPTQAKLYGQHLWQSGGKRLVIAKGEIDTVTIAQAQNLKWPTVGIPGYQYAADWIKRSYEWVNSFSEIVLAFDHSEVGNAAAEQIAVMFPPGKIKIMQYGQYTDANHMLMENQGDRILQMMFQASDYRPDGIVFGDELWEDIIKEPTPGLELPFPELNRRLLGARPAQIFLLTAGSGLGKSTLAHEIGYHFMTKHGKKIGNLCLEEQAGRTAKRYIGMYLNQQIHITHAGVTQEKIKEAYDATINSKNWCLYRHRGSKDIRTIESKIRFMAVGLGMEWIILDHISIVVSGLDEIGESERKTIDKLMTLLSTLVEELGIGLIAIVHLKRKDGTPFNEGGKVSITDMRGSGGLEQMSHVIISLERNQQQEDKKNYCLLRLLKDRDIGDTGVCDVLKYEPQTGRLLYTDEITAEDLNGKKGKTNQFKNHHEGSGAEDFC